MRIDPDTNIETDITGCHECASYEREVKALKSKLGQAVEQRDNAMRDAFQKGLRLDSYRERTIVKSEEHGHKRCIVCRGIWAYEYAAEMHEEWCPNKQVIVETHQHKLVDPSNEVVEAGGWKMCVECGYLQKPASE